MSNNQLTNPLLSMAATILMCAILSACHTTNASTDRVSQISGNASDRHHVSNHHNIRIREHDGHRLYTVDGKEFTYDQLSDEQKEKINQIEEKLSKLETALELDSQRMEKWSQKMEIVAERMEREAERFEDVVEDLEFDMDSKSIDVEHISKSLNEASRQLEVKMLKLEEKMHEMEIKIPAIDELKISEIELQAEKLETLLIEIAKNM